MAESELLKQIAKKDSDKEKIATKVIGDGALLSEVYEGLKAEKANVKYGCVKILCLISEKSPQTLYPKIDFFIKLFDSDNQIFKWNAIHIVADLTAVDTKNKFEKVFAKYFAPISGSVMITAANTIKGAVKIVLSKPELTEKVTKELLRVSQAKYETVECCNVAIGHTIKAFDQFFDQVQDKETVIKFVKKQLKNKRKATQKKAQEFMNKRKV